MLIAGNIVNNWKYYLPTTDNKRKDNAKSYFPFIPYSQATKLKLIFNFFFGAAKPNSSVRLTRPIGGFSNNANLVSIDNFWRQKSFSKSFFLFSRLLALMNRMIRIGNVSSFTELKHVSHFSFKSFYYHFHRHHHHHYYYFELFVYFSFAFLQPDSRQHFSRHIS